MMATEQGNRFISEAFSREAIILDEVIKICDLGDTFIQLTKHNNQQIVTLDMPSIETLGKLGLKDHLKKIYSNAEVELTGDSVVIKDRSQAESNELPLLRLHCLGYPIILCIQAMQAGIQILIICRSIQSTLLDPFAQRPEGINRVLLVSRTLGQGHGFPWNQL